MPTKIKKTQPETPKTPQGRDLFQTPNYATELLLPFIPKEISFIWEPACGNFKISNVLSEFGFHVYNSDLDFPVTGDNFLTNEFPFTTYKNNGGIITNPPFSLKQKFYHRCKEFNVPFALLIPMDMAGWLAKAFDIDGCQGVVPYERVNYITPTGLNEQNGHTSNFHSFWLTWGFNLPNMLNFCHITKEDRKNM